MDVVKRKTSFKISVNIGIVKATFAKVWIEKPKRKTKPRKAKELR